MFARFGRKRTTNEPIVDKPATRMAASDVAELELIADEMDGHFVDAVVDAVYERTMLGNLYSKRRIKTALSRYRRRKAHHQHATEGYSGRLARLHHELVRLVPRQPIGRRIAFVLDFSGLTQSWLAAAAKVSERQITYWINGETLPRVDAGYRIAQAFGLSADLFWREQMFGESEIEMAADEMAMTSRELAVARRAGRHPTRQFVS